MRRPFDDCNHLSIHGIGAVLKDQEGARFGKSPWISLLENYSVQR